MRISTHIEVYESSEDDCRLFISNSKTQVFVSFRPSYLRPSEGHKHGVSIHSLTDLSETFLLSPAPNIAQTRVFARQFRISIFFYLFDSWLYLLNGFDDGVTLKTGNSVSIFCFPNADHEVINISFEISRFGRAYVHITNKKTGGIFAAEYYVVCKKKTKHTI